MRDEGWVYVVRYGPFYKIGYSHNPAKRIKELSTKPPFKLEKVHEIKWHKARSLETELHKLFADSRVNGEWFELNELQRDMLVDIAAIIREFNYHRLRLSVYHIGP